MIKLEKMRTFLYFSDRRRNVLTGAWFPFILFIVAVFCLNCSGNQQEKQNVATMLPSNIPEETVTSLYNDSLFFNLRNAISSDIITHLSPCMTTELVAQFEVFNKDIEVWMKQNEDAGLKLPVREGPIFLSNYEGADSFKVGKSSINGRLAKVPISLSVTDVMGSFQWIDVVILKQVEDVWLVDNIEFQSTNDNAYTLRDRVSLVQ